VVDDTREPDDDQGPASNGTKGNSTRYYHDVCKKFDAYYRKKFPQAERSPCAVLYDYPKFSEKFQAYLKEYKPLGYNSSKERRMRFANFAANVVFMLEQGKKHQAFELAVNAYADMTPEEFKATKLGLNETRPVLGAEPPVGQALPESLDWVQLGGVTEPVNQGSCNSCWTFATAGALEGAWFALTGKLVDLSKGQLLDCTGDPYGCKYGGTLEAPYDTVARQHGICTEESYVYTGEQGGCHQSSCTTAIPLGAIQGYKAVMSNNEQALKEALVKTGPVAVGIDASGDEVRFYSRGVLTAPCSDALNHAVLVVGYGVEDPNPYWRLKNSWGTRWGEGGFFRLVRGLEGSGECGLKKIPTIPALTTEGVQVPQDVPTVAPARLDASQGSAVGAILGSKSAVIAAAVVAGMTAGGCLFLICRQCCCRSAKTRGMEVAPLYSPVCVHGSDSEDEEHPYGHPPH
jgi:xylem cysteine proteinase